MKNESVQTSEPSATGNCSVMPDVQASADQRRIAIDKVGVKDVTYPITLRTPDGGCQSTVASINMYVSLPHYQKGTHMSRFLEVLNENAQGITPERIPEITREIRKRLDAEDAHLELRFTYFIRKAAPVTKQAGLMDYQVRFEATANGAVSRAAIGAECAADAFTGAAP